MNIIKLLILPIFLSLIFYLPLASEKDKLFTLIVSPVIISGDKKSGHLPDEVSMIIQKYLLEDVFFRINDKTVLNNKITIANCLKKECAAELKGITPEGVVIMISVTAVEIKTGEKRLSRYVVEDITEMRYTVHVSTADLQKEKYDLVFRSTYTNTSKLLDEAERIGEKIREFYIKEKSDS